MSGISFAGVAFRDAAHAAAMARRDIALKLQREYFAKLAECPVCSTRIATHATTVKHGYTVLKLEFMCGAAFTVGEHIKIDGYCKTSTEREVGQLSKQFYSRAEQKKGRRK